MVQKLTVALTGFVNPSYPTPEGWPSSDANAAKGFAISGADTVAFAFEGTAVATLNHQQTMDPDGLTGWFSVGGKRLSDGLVLASNGMNAMGVGYKIPVTGIRHRVVVTALTTADLIMRYNLLESDYDQSGGGTVALGASTAQIGHIDGWVAHDAVNSGNPVKIGARAISAAYTAVASGDVADLVATLQGAQIIRPYAIPEDDWVFASAAISTVVNTTIRTAGAAGQKRYITSCQLQNAGATASVVEIRSGAGGSVLWRGKLGASMLDFAEIVFPSPLQSAAATLLEFAVLTAGGEIYANFQGYSAA